MKYIVDGNYIEAHVDDFHYYCTNKSGNGLFYVDLDRNDRKQIEGTSQFSVAGVADKKGKLRRYLRERNG